MISFDSHDISRYPRYTWYRHISWYSQYIIIFMISHDIRNISQYPWYTRYSTIFTIHHDTLIDASRYSVTRYIAISLMYTIYHDIHENPLVCYAKWVVLVWGSTRAGNMLQTLRFTNEKLRLSGFGVQLEIAGDCYRRWATLGRSRA